MGIHRKKASISMQSEYGPYSCFIFIPSINSKPCDHSENARYTTQMSLGVLSTMTAMRMMSSLLSFILVSPLSLFSLQSLFCNDPLFILGSYPSICILEFFHLPSRVVVMNVRFNF